MKVRITIEVERTDPAQTNSYSNYTQIYQQIVDKTDDPDDKISKFVADIARVVNGDPA